MNAYGAYMEKRAIGLGGLMGGANSLMQIPQNVGLIGTGLKFLGKHVMGGPTGGVARAGEFIEHHSTQVSNHVNDFMNKGPGMHYDLSKAPGVVRKPLGMIGMNTEGPQKLTAQRAAVWGGGAIALHNIASGFSGASSSAAAGVGNANHFMPPGYQSQANKMAAVKQAREDFVSLMEETR